MGTVAHTDHTMKLFVLAALVACASSRPRFLVIPLDDMQDLELIDVMQNFPMYRMPGLARQARAAQEEDSYQSAPHFLEPRDTPPASPDHVDYGAYTGGYGAFGWYTDHPVLLTA